MKLFGIITILFLNLSAAHAQTDIPIDTESFTTIPNGSQINLWARLGVWTPNMLAGSHSAGIFDDEDDTAPGHPDFVALLHYSPSTVTRSSYGTFTVVGRKRGALILDYSSKYDPIIYPTDNSFIENGTQFALTCKRHTHLVMERDCTVDEFMDELQSAPGALTLNPTWLCANDDRTFRVEVDSIHNNMAWVSVYGPSLPNGEAFYASLLKGEANNKKLTQYSATGFDLSVRTDLSPSEKGFSASVISDLGSSTVFCSRTKFNQ